MSIHTIQKAVSLLLPVLLVACGRPKELPPAAYVAWMEDERHGCVKKITAGDYEYTLQLATPEYMAAQETADVPELLQNRARELKGHVYILVRMATTAAYRKHAGGRAEDQRRMEGDAMTAYYDQAASSDMTLSGRAPVSYHFENNYGLTPYNTIVAAFETGDAGSDLQFVFNDRFRNIPHIQAGFPEPSLQDLPQLQY